MKKRYIIAGCIAAAIAVIGAVSPAVADGKQDTLQSDYYQACMTLGGDRKDSADCTARAAKYVLDKAAEKAADDRKAAQDTEKRAREKALGVGVMEPTATASLPFAEVFPTDAVDAECARYHNVQLNNMCIDANQTYYDYDRAMWASLRLGRKQFCIASAKKFHQGIGFYQLLEPCLENEVRWQDQETAHSLKTW
jgi:hypothetical protein